MNTVDETKKWLVSIESMIELLVQNEGKDKARMLLHQVFEKVRETGIPAGQPVSTPYINSIPKEEEPDYPGDREIERKIKSLIRWNAMAMVVKANREKSGLGGHISTYASAATLYEVGFNHFFNAGSENRAGDLIFFQGHASPGIYSRAFLEYRLDEAKLGHFVRNLLKEEAFLLIRILT